MTYNTQTSPRVKIDFILPLQDGMQEFKYFMQMFEQVSRYFCGKNIMGLSLRALVHRPA